MRTATVTEGEAQLMESTTLGMSKTYGGELVHTGKNEMYQERIEGSEVVGEVYRLTRKGNECKVHEVARYPLRETPQQE